MSARLLILILILLLTGCAGTAERQTPHYIHEVSPGTLLSLERSLPFKAGSLRVFLQDGQVHHGFGFFGHGGVNRYRAHCVLELKQKTVADMELVAREYRLTAVQWDVTYLMLDSSEFRTEWRLSGGGEPAAHAFVCRKIGNAAYERHLTLEEIDHVVGDYFRLKAATTQ